jgi:hypothetical protein
MLEWKNLRRFFKKPLHIEMKKVVVLEIVLALQRW